MPEILLTIFFITVLLFFLGSGIWVAISMIGVSTIGMILFTSRPVGDAMATTIWGTASSWTLTALPLFVWMGEILFRTKLSENLFKGLSPWMQKLPGGLIHVNVVGCALFAAISGSSAAPVATVGPSSPVLPPKPTVMAEVITEYHIWPAFNTDFFRLMAYKALGIPWPISFLITYFMMSTVRSKPTNGNKKYKTL